LVAGLCHRRCAGPCGLWGRPGESFVEGVWVWMRGKES
jgi:hypothetical protein